MWSIGLSLLNTWPILGRNYHVNVLCETLEGFIMLQLMILAAGVLLGFTIAMFAMKPIIERMNDLAESLEKKYDRLSSIICEWQKNASVRPRL